MKNFNSLINLLRKLSSEELKSLLKFLNYYNEKNKWTKSRELVELILKEKDLNAISIQKRIYGNQNSHAFNKLVDRLKDKILDVVLFDSNISKDYYPERVQVLFDLKKKLIQCDVLSLKGLRDDGDSLCKKIISKAEKYELYDIVMNALVIRQRFVNIRKKQVEVKTLQNGIQVAESKFKSIISSQNIYNSILNKINNASDNKSYYLDLKTSINKIEELYRFHKSDIVGYYLFFLKTELFQVEGNYLRAEECLKTINQLLKKKSIYSENRVGTTLLNIANNELHLGKYNEAIISANSAKKYFPNNVFNQALVEEYLFYANFYKGNFMESEVIIKKLVNLPVANSILFSINKWNYFHAVINFVKQDFQSCIEILNDISEMDKDKEGWNINKRLLQIMTRIELKQFESVDLQVSSLEKFIKRSLKRRDIRFRYIYIIRILIKLINSNYNFTEVLESRKRYFSLLSSENNDFKWIIKSPELIIFDSWFKSNINEH